MLIWEIWEWLNTLEGLFWLHVIGLSMHAKWGSLDFTRKRPGGVGGWSFQRWGMYVRTQTSARPATIASVKRICDLHRFRR